MPRNYMWIVTVLLVATGAGAAVGPVLSPRLTGRVAITATQALQFEQPIVPTVLSPQYYLGASDVFPPPYAKAPAITRVYTSLNDQKTDFTVSVDLLPTSSKFDILLPIGNLANNQVLALLTLDSGGCLELDVEPLGHVYAYGGQPNPINVGGLVKIGRMGPNSWEIMAPARTHASDTANGITGYNGAWIHVALANGLPPGYYTLRGTLEAQNR